MYLDFSDFRVRVEIENESSITSKHTGSMLRKLSVNTAITGQELNEDFLSLIDRAKQEKVVCQILCKKIGPA